MHDLKFDSIVNSRIVKRKNEEVEIQSLSEFPFDSVYSTFYVYYGAIAPIICDSGYLKIETEAQVETNLYASNKPDGVLVWSSTIDTVDPRSLTSAVDGIVKLLVKQFEKDKK